MDGKSIARKLVGDDEERAVSPVIGVILMVAITVILASVIAVFVLDLGESVEQDVQAGVTIEGDTVTWTSEGTAASVGQEGNPTGTSSDCLDSVGESKADASSWSSVVAYEEDNCNGSGTVIDTLD